MHDWFVLKSGLVSGPFSSEKVQSSFKNQNVLIWGLDSNEWLEFSDWQSQLNSGSFNSKNANETEQVAKDDSDSLLNSNSNSKSKLKSDPNFKLKSESNSNSESATESTSVATSASKSVSDQNDISNFLSGPSYESSADEEATSASPSQLNSDLDLNSKSALEKKSKGQSASEPAFNSEKPALSAKVFKINPISEKQIHQNNKIEQNAEQIDNQAEQFAQQTLHQDHLDLELNQNQNETQNENQMNLEEEIILRPHLRAINKSDFEKTAVAPLPKLPNVDDIFPLTDDEDLSNEDTFQESNQQITHLDDQLKDLMTHEDFGNEGKTLIQATMEVLSSDQTIAEEESSKLNLSEDSFFENTSSASSPSEDSLSENSSAEVFNDEHDLMFNPVGATQVQSFDLNLFESEESLKDESTRVQGFDMNVAETLGNQTQTEDSTRVQGFDISSIESDISLETESTRVQNVFSSLGSVNPTEYDNDGATKVQISMDDLSRELFNEDGATKVQSFELNSAESTQVQSFSSNSAESTQVQSFSSNSAESTQVQNFLSNPAESTQIQNIDNAKMSTYNEDQDGATKVQISMDDLASEFVNEDGPTKIQSVLPNLNEINRIKDSGEINMSHDAKSGKNGAEKNQNLEDKANVEELKGMSQSIEQKKILENPIWYVAYNGVSYGPMNVENLLKKLDTFEHREFIYLWKKGFADWQNLFDTPQISFQLGIGFRRHDRYPFTGTVKIEYNGNVQIGQLENLSASGLGATGFGPLVLGEKVKVTLDCPELDHEVEFTALIRFTSESGVLGLSFIHTEYAENISKVIDLVREASLKLVA